MPLTLVTVPCLTDNYAFLLHDESSGRTALVDAPEAAPVAAELDRRGWRLSAILLTHHHDDHVQAVAALRAGAEVIGASADAHRLPPLDHAVRPGETFDLFGETVHVIDVPGHTRGHVAYYLPASGLVLTGDSLMAMGCGRLFEGTAAEMWGSLSRLMALPPATLVASGHEYTAANLRFAQGLGAGDDALAARADRIATARAAGRPTVPSTLAEEIATNPFLRAADPGFARAVGIEGAPAEVFAELRRRKDRA